MTSILSGSSGVSPSPPAELGSERVAAIVAGRAEIAAKNLEIWNPQPPAHYSLATEVEGVRRFAQEKAWAAYHLVGFSAAATVVLAAALRGGLPARSLTVIEPATIGDDDWSPVEAAWRRRIDEIFTLEPAAHQQAFIEQMLPPGAEVPPRKVYPDEDIERDFLLYQGAIRHTGFSTGELNAISNRCWWSRAAQAIRGSPRSLEDLARSYPTGRLIDFSDL